MYNDLAKMAKSKGIYRTLALCAILSHKPVGNETVKYSRKKEDLNADKQVNVVDVSVNDECMASLR